MSAAILHPLAELSRHQTRSFRTIRDNSETTVPRVLFLDHTAAMGGGEIALLNLVREFDRRRYVPVVLLFSDGPLVKHLKASGIETHIVPLDSNVVKAAKDSLGGSTLLRLRDAISAAGYCWELAGWIGKLRVALVHTNSLKSDILGGVATRIAGVPLIWHVRDRIADDYLPKAIARVFRVLAALMPQRLITNSRATLSTLPVTERGRRSTARPLRGAVVVHDGTILPDITEPCPPAPYPKIGLVGRIAPWKGQDIFLRAAAKIHRRFPNARFQIIGSALFHENAFEQRVIALRDELALGEVVEFTGFRQDVPDLIRQLDVLVHASTSGEPFGQVVIEGMAASKPVVATRGGGIPEIVLDGQTGVLVPMGDDAAMTEAVCELLLDPARARRMGEAGRERVRSLFTVQHVARNVHRVYDELLR